MMTSYDFRPGWLFCFIFVSSIVVQAEGNANGTLPRSLIPLHYDIELIPDFYSDSPKNFTLRCTTDVFVKCTNDTRELHFHATNMTIDWSRLFVTSLDGKQVETGNKTYDKNQIWKVNLTSTLVKGSKYYVHFETQGKIHVGARFGLHASSYDYYGDKRFLISIQAQPVFARTIFPCFDEPGLKATFSITVLRKYGYIALSNTRKLESKARKYGWVADTFARTPKMSTYTVALVVCPREYAHVARNWQQREKQLVNVTLWSRPVNPPHRLLDLVEGAIRTMNRMENYLRVPYPLPKIDLVTIPSFPADGGMESWGLITYKEEAIFHEGINTTSANMGHEIAHQWFGNLVTCSSWSDLWLNEGLGSYLHILAKKPNERPPISVKKRMAIMEGDSYVTSLPVVRNANTLDETMAMFSDPVYKKAPYIVQMLHQLVGEKAMQIGLERYLVKYSYGVANTSTFCDIMNKTLQDVTNDPFDIKVFLLPWLKQQNHPLVTISLKDKALVIKQEPFVKPGLPKDNGGFGLRNYFNLTEKLFQGKYDDFGHKWSIPLVLVTNTTIVEEKTTKVKGKRDVVWLHKAEATVTEINGKAVDPRAWILADPGHIGFFRVNYDNTLWRRLIDQLILDHTVIPLANRHQILYDVMEYVRMDRISPDLPLILGDYMQKTLDPYEWELFLSGTGFYADVLESSGSKLYQDFKKFMLSIMAPTMRALQNRNDPKLRRILTTWIMRYSTNYTRQCEATKHSCETISNYLTESIKNRKNTKRIEDILDQVLKDGFISDVLDLYVNNLAFFHDREMHGLLMSIIQGTASLANAKTVEKTRLEHPLVVKSWKDEFVVAEQVINRNIKWAKSAEKKIENVLKIKKHAKESNDNKRTF